MLCPMNPTSSPPHVAISKTTKRAREFHAQIFHDGVDINLHYPKQYHHYQLTQGNIFAPMAASFNHQHFRCNFDNWIAQQHEDLDELLSALSTDPVSNNDEKCKDLVEKCVNHFEEYCERRGEMVQHDAPCFMSPPWCSSFENAFMWIGGCRPSLFFRLLYYVCGSELDTQLDEFLQGRRRGNLAEMSAKQLDIINTLHCNTLKEEDRFSSRIASLQEEIADEPLAMLAKMGGRVGEWSEELERAMGTHSKLLASILADADRLRLGSFKELVAILTPLQATDLLIATNQLHIFMHEWGKRKKCQKQH